MDSSEFDSSYYNKSAYKAWVEDHVRFNDLDVLGHVSSVRTNEYFAGVRTNLFRHAIPSWPTSAQVPVLKINIIRHEAEITFPQSLKTGLSVEKFGNTSVTLVMGLFSEDKCLALCRNIFVFIDSKTRQAVIPSDEIKQNFLKFAG